MDLFGYYTWNVEFDGDKPGPEGDFNISFQGQEHLFNKVTFSGPGQNFFPTINASIQDNRKTHPVHPLRNSLVFHLDLELSAHNPPREVFREFPGNVLEHLRRLFPGYEFSGHQAFFDIM